MYKLTEGALDKIMNGIDIEKPILQVLGYKKLPRSTNKDGTGTDRYRLLMSDGQRLNSFTMLATQLNNLITDEILTENAICKVLNYHLSTVNNGGKEKRVMLLLDIEVMFSGSEVGHKIGNPTNADSKSEPDAAKSDTSATMQYQTNNTVKQSTGNSHASSDISTTPIAALSPYQNRWVIKVRVTNKSSIRTWSNSRGEGKLFSMDLIDESGEIRCTAFKDMCDKFYDMIEAGNVYYISRCALKAANKQFNTLKNDYEMTMTNDTEIVPCHENSDDIPTLQFNFCSISQLENKEKNDVIASQPPWWNDECEEAVRKRKEALRTFRHCMLYSNHLNLIHAKAVARQAIKNAKRCGPKKSQDFADVLGIVTTFSDVQHLTQRNTGRELTKRDINIVDDSGTQVCVTLWGKQAEDFDGSNNPILAIKGARISEFNGGKSLSLINSSVIEKDPDLAEAHKLRGWYTAGGHLDNVKSLSRAGGGGDFSGPLYTFQEATEARLGEKLNVPDSYTVVATINMIRVENSIYKSCPVESCKKKLIDQSTGIFRCEKCNKDYPNFIYRLLASMNIADATGNRWITAFSEDAEKILGMSAQELGELKENDNDAYMQKFGEANFKRFTFNLRAKSEIFQDEMRVRHTCASVTPLNYKTHLTHLIDRVSKLAHIEKLESN